MDSNTIKKKLDNHLYLLDLLHYYQQ